VGLRIEKIKTKKPVYDISVEDNNNFFANNILVHNCGEQMLAPGGCCNLSSINLTQFYKNNKFLYKDLEKYARYAVRFLDNINDLSDAALPEYIYSMRNKRRIGLGILGWGSLLYMMKIKFASEEAFVLKEKLMKIIVYSAIDESIKLAEEKGKFSLCDPLKHSEAKFFKQIKLPKEYIKRMEKTGIRNASLFSQQPTGNSAIFSNVVSGGIEPVFMPEYIRTIIVNKTPEHISDVTPKWYEGEFHETEMFKFVKEGDDKILRGVDENNVVYKIDQNRGLTKEVLCEDYGVRYLKENNEWDPEADWVVCTTDLNVDDHVNDMKGFARWTDSSLSKCMDAKSTMVIINDKIKYLDELPYNEVDSFNEYTGTILNHHKEKINVTSVYNNGMENTITVTFDDKSKICCTFNHKIYTERGWIRASDILIGDIIK